MDRTRDPDLAVRLFGSRPEHTLALLRAAWPAAVGPELARRTEVVALDRGILRIKVPDAGWQRSLLRMRGDILSRLRSVAGGAAPRGLGFVVGPVAEPPAPALAPPVAPLPRAPRAVSEAAAVDPRPRDPRALRRRGGALPRALPRRSGRQRRLGLELARRLRRLRRGGRRGGGQRAQPLDERDLAAQERHAQPRPDEHEEPAARRA